jgi:histidinol-phosphate phosphatase family protein
VFLDRDGTLVRETGYLANPDELELLPGVTRALRNLSDAGVPLVVISNQAGVGRGLFTAARVHEVMARLRRRLRAEGVEISAIYFCPHRPDEGCPCRKPKTGLLERAAEDQHLSLAGSVMIGDKRIDAAAGRNAGGRGILVRTGYGREEEGRTDVPGPPPSQVCDDLAAAVAWWLGPE